MVLLVMCIQLILNGHWIHSMVRIISVDGTEIKIIVVDLLVHKSTHHFDLVNFWLNTTPDTVYATGGLRFYGKENAEARGETKFYQRAHGSENAKNDPFAIQLEDNDHLKALYLDAEKDDGYQRDQSVFGDGIDIEDTLGVMVTYKNKAILTYSLNAYLPWEGFIVSFNGSKGRIEVQVREQSYINSGGSKSDEGKLKEKSVRVSADVW